MYLIFCGIDYHLGHRVTEHLDLAETTPNYKLYNVHAMAMTSVAQ